MRSTIVICYFLIIVLAPSARSAGEGVNASFKVQGTKIQDAVAPRLLASAQWALVAEDVASGKQVVETDNAGTVALVPASLVKLFVAGAVFEQAREKPLDLGTVVAKSGKLDQGVLQGNLVIRGGGNPFLSAADLQGAVDKIKAQKIISKASICR